MVERGPDGLTVIENDRLSIVHSHCSHPDAGLELIAQLAEASRRSGRSGRRRRPAGGAGFRTGRSTRVGIAGRAGLAAAGGLATVIAMLLLFPGLRDGPLGHVDPLYARVRLQHIVEIQPLVSRAWLAAGEYAQAARRVLEIVGIALAAVPFLVVLLVRRRGAARRIWAWVALALSIYLALAAYQVRWSDYAELLLVLPFGAFVAWLLGHVTARTSARAAQIWRPLIVVGCLFSPILIAQLLPQHAIQTAGETCPIASLAPVLVHDAGGRSKTIFAFADYGPEILYRTPHSVLSIPNHRPQPGFAATYRVADRAGRDRARALLARAGSIGSCSARAPSSAICSRPPAAGTRISTSAWPMARSRRGPAPCRCRAISRRACACSRWFPTRRSPAAGAPTRGREAPCPRPWSW